MAVCGSKTAIARQGANEQERVLWAGNFLFFLFNVNLLVNIFCLMLAVDHECLKIGLTKFSPILVSF